VITAVVNQRLAEGSAEGSAEDDADGSNQVGANPPWVKVCAFRDIRLSRLLTMRNTRGRFLTQSTSTKWFWESSLLDSLPSRIGGGSHKKPCAHKIRHRRGYRHED